MKHIFLVLVGGSHFGLFALSPHNWKNLYEHYQHALDDSKRVEGNKKVAKLSEAKRSLDLLVTDLNHTLMRCQQAHQFLNKQGEQVDRFESEIVQLQTEVQRIQGHLADLATKKKEARSAHQQHRVAKHAAEAAAMDNRVSRLRHKHEGMVRSVTRDLRDLAAEAEDEIAGVMADVEDL